MLSEFLNLPKITHIIFLHSFLFYNFAIYRNKQKMSDISERDQLMVGLQSFAS